MKTIPTAEEFLTVCGFTPMAITTQKLDEMLIEFAKLHVEAALKAAYDKFSIKYNEGDVDLNLIKNAYPLTNIK